MEMLFPITSNTAITVSCKHLFTTVVSVLLAFLLGIIEIDGMLGVHILRDLGHQLHFFYPCNIIFENQVFPFQAAIDILQTSAFYMNRIDR